MDEAVAGVRSGSVEEGGQGWLMLLRHHDERALHALIMRRRDSLNRAMCTVSYMGSAGVVILLVVAMLMGWLPGFERVGRYAGFSLVVSHLLVQLLKRTISRPRPRMPEGFLSLAKAPDRFSFPSGHSAAALSLAIPLAASLPFVFGALSMGIALLVGLSRCYLGVHYPGDVLAGWMLAAGSFVISIPLLG